MPIPKKSLRPKSPPNLRYCCAAATGLALLVTAAPPGNATDFSQIQIVPHPHLRGVNAGPAPQDEYGRPEYEQQVGTGLEHANLAVCGDTLLLAGVGSYASDSNGIGPDLGDDNDDDYLQTMVVAGRLTSSGLQLSGAYYVFPNLNDGNRNRDGLKPGVACLDSDLGLYTAVANYAPDANAVTYAGVFHVGGSGSDVSVTQIAAATEVLANDDDDCSDRDSQDVLARKTGNGDYIVNLTGSCNGNGDDVAWITYFDVTCDGTSSCEIDKGPKEQVSQDEIERFRPNTYQLGASTYLAIGTEGDNQPPRDGISATVFNGNNLDILSQSIIAESDDDVLSTMSHGAQIASDAIIVSYQARPDRSSDNDGKGETVLKMGVLKASSSGEVGWLAEPVAGLLPGFSAAHHSACSTNFGYVGSEKPSGFFVSSSLQGGSAARGYFVSYDAAAGQLVQERSVTLGTRIDNRLLSNYYGNNPGRQGKNSIYCATMRNPSYGVAGGYMSDVREFVVVPATSRIVNQAGELSPKLGLDVVLVPAVVDAPPPPETPPGEEEPGTEEPGTEEPGTEEPGNDPGDDVSGDPGPEPNGEGDAPSGDGDGEGDDGSAPDSPGPKRAKTTSGCQVGGGSSEPLLLLLLAVVFAGWRRSRKEGRHA